jgi:hypothetical protein
MSCEIVIYFFPRLEEIALLVKVAFGLQSGIKMGMGLIIGWNVFTIPCLLGGFESNLNLWGHF